MPKNKKSKRRGSPELTSYLEDFEQAVKEIQLEFLETAVEQKTDDLQGSSGLQQIFAFIPFHTETLLSAMLVCKRWHAAALQFFESVIELDLSTRNFEHLYQWESITGSPHRILRHSPVLSILHHFTNLENFSLENQFLPEGPALTKILRCFSKLKHVNLSGAGVDSSAMCMLAQRCPNIERIILVPENSFDVKTGIGFTDTALLELSEKSHFLKEIAIEMHETGLFGVTRETLATFLGKCKNLDRLSLINHDPKYISYPNFDREYLSFPLEFHADLLSRLKHLHVRRTISYSSLRFVLRAATNLESFAYSYPTLKNCWEDWRNIRSAVFDFDALKECPPTLTALSLHVFMATPVKKLFSLIPQLAQLQVQKFDFRESPVVASVRNLTSLSLTQGDLSTTALTSLLSSAQNLQSINLNDVWGLGDAFLPIFQSQKTLPGLTNIALSENECPTSTLFSILFTCPNLQDLVFCRSKMAPAELAANRVDLGLFADLPQPQLHSFYLGNSGLINFSELSFLAPALAAVQRLGIKKCPKLSTIGGRLATFVASTMTTLKVASLTQLPKKDISFIVDNIPSLQILHADGEFTGLSREIIWSSEKTEPLTDHHKFND